MKRRKVVGLLEFVNYFRVVVKREEDEEDEEE